MALNAHAIFDGDYAVLLPLTSPLPDAPGSADYALSIAWMRRATALLLGIWVVADLVQDERWLLRICWAIGLAGGSIALLGLLQKATGAEVPFWQSRNPGEQPVIFVFRKLLLSWQCRGLLEPGVAGRPRARFSLCDAAALIPFARALWVTLSLIMIVAVISNTSRMGQLIGVLIGLVLLAFFAGNSSAVWDTSNQDGGHRDRGRRGDIVDDHAGESSRSCLQALGKIPGEPGGRCPLGGGRGGDRCPADRGAARVWSGGVQCRLPVLQSVRHLAGWLALSA